jgi:hypothetical protein
MISFSEVREIQPKANQEKAIKQIQNTGRFIFYLVPSKNSRLSSNN